MDSVDGQSQSDPLRDRLRSRLRRRAMARAGLATPAGLVPGRLQVGDLTREYIAAPPPGPGAPLLLVLHGAGGTGAGMAALTGLAVRGPAAGFGAVFPDGWRLVEPFHEGRDESSEEL